jgi:hypothetical protein
MNVDTKPLIRRIDALVREHGSLRNVGIELDIDPGLLSRIRAGKVSPVSGGTLEKLGFSVKVTYHKEF